MDGRQLREKISGWNLSQIEFAQWLHVSAGAVTQWLADTRAIPGPVIAYIKLFESLPTSLQTLHLSQARRGTLSMDGMYVVEFTGSDGSGGATLTLKNGSVYGFDLGGGIYDGFYKAGSTPGTVDVEVVVKMPAGRPSVIRGIVQPFDWSVIAKASLPVNLTRMQVVVSTNMNETLMATITRMRGLPIAA